MVAWLVGGNRQPGGEHQPFPQPSSLSAALLERQLVLLGSLLATVSEANQLQILDVLTAAATGPAPTKRGVKESPLRRKAVLTAVCCTALAGLDSLARRYRGACLARSPRQQPSRLVNVATISVAALRSCARGGGEPRRRRREGARPCRGRPRRGHSDRGRRAPEERRGNVCTRGLHWQRRKRYTAAPKPVHIDGFF